MSDSRSSSPRMSFRARPPEYSSFQKCFARTSPRHPGSSEAYAMHLRNRLIRSCFHCVDSIHQFGKYCLSCRTYYCLCAIATAASVCNARSSYYVSYGRLRSACNQSWECEEKSVLRLTCSQKWPASCSRANRLRSFNTCSAACHPARHTSACSLS